jgi:hypothetical protein
MTQHSNDQDDNDLELSRLYQKVSDELPSSELDKNILWQAKQAAERQQLNKDSDVDKRSYRQSKESRFWFKWQWGGSVAASALLLSVIWFANTPDQAFTPTPDNEPLVLLDAASSADMALSDITGDDMVAQTALSHDAMKTSTQARFSSAPEERVADTVLESEVLETYATNSLVKRESTPPKPESLMLDSVASSVRSSEVNELKTKPDTVVSRHLTAADSAIASREFKPKVLIADVELDALAQKAKRFQRGLYNTEIQNAEDEKALMEKLTMSQNRLMSLIVLRKQQTPNWEVPKKYLDVLTPEQRKQLLD